MDFPFPPSYSPTSQSPRIPEGGVAPSALQADEKLVSAAASAMRIAPRRVALGGDCLGEHASHSLPRVSARAVRPHLFPSL